MLEILRKYDGYKYQATLVRRTPATLEVQMQGYARTIIFRRSRTNPAKYVEAVSGLYCYA